jgi:hypothetical protein
VVLKIGELQITQAAFEQYLADLESQQGPADKSRRELGDHYASMLMLSQQATANRLDSEPQVQRLLAIDRMQILSNAEFAKLKVDSVPTKEEIQEYYNTHGEEYDEIEMRRIFVWAADPSSKSGLTPDKAKAFAAQVRQILGSGGDSERLLKLVKETPHNQDEIVIDQKPLPFHRGELPAQMSEKAFSLKAGEWTELENGPNARLFLQVVNRSHVDLSRVSEQIETKLQNQKLKAELEGLKKKTGLWMDETYFVPKPPVPAFQDRD